MSRGCCFNARAVALFLLRPRALWAMYPKINNASETINGELISVAAWHAQALTNVTWDIPAWKQNASHSIVITWDEEATDIWLFGIDNISSRANTPPSSSATSIYWPALDEPAYDACTLRGDAFNSSSKDAFHTEENWTPSTSVDLADETTWWYAATLSQDAPTATTLTSGAGNASVMLTAPGLYSVCLLAGNETCVVEECANFTVYQPSYDFLEIESTNVGKVVSVRFNLISRYAYSGDWGWVLGGVDPSASLEHANSLTPSQAGAKYDERCWFYIGRAIELGSPFLCSRDPDPELASLQSTPTLRAYQFGWFELFDASAGNESFWFAKHEKYTYAMLKHFYTCGITVQPLNNTSVATTSDLVVTAVPEQGPTCEVGDGIGLQIRTAEIPPHIEDVDAWIYFNGRVVNVSHDVTSLSIRLPYIGIHQILVYLSSGAALDTLNVTAVAADPYAPACDVTERPPGVSPIDSSVYALFKARDFYSNVISRSWGNDTFESWTYNSIDNATAAEVHDEGNGSYRVVTADLSVSGTTFLFVQRNDLGVPGSPFEVYVFGPSTCKVVSTVGDCQSNLLRPIVKMWAANSPCKGIFDDPVRDGVSCDSVPVGSTLGKAMITSSTLAGLYAAMFLVWIRQNRETVVVKLSQPFVCQLFLLGCILLNLTTVFHLGVPSDAACLGRPWMLHVALTFTSSCLYMKTYRVHRIFNSPSKLSRISITDRHLVTWVLQLVAVDVALLIVWTVMDRPRVVVHTVVDDAVVVTNSECTGTFDFPLFSTILWSWKACLNMFGVVIAAKTWHCEDGVGESHSICLCVYNTTLLALANVAIQLALSGNTAMKEVASSFSAVAGTLFIVSVLFGPKVYRLWWYGDISSNAAERRGSATMTYDPRRSSLTENQSLGEILRRTSSASGPALDFSRIGKVAPITEDPSELLDGRRRSETPATSSVPPG